MRIPIHVHMGANGKMGNEGTTERLTRVRVYKCFVGLRHTSQSHYDSDRISSNCDGCPATTVLLEWIEACLAGHDKGRGT